MILSDTELAIVYARAAELVDNGWTKAFCAFNRDKSKAYTEKELYNLPELENTSFCVYGALVYAAREKQILLAEDRDSLDVLLPPLIEYLNNNDYMIRIEVNKRPLVSVANWNDHSDNSKEHVVDALDKISRNLQSSAQGNGC